MAIFEGFSHQTVSFYENLAQHNDRGWFETQKEVYAQAVLTPAQAFVLAMGDRLRALSPAIIADPRLNGSGSVFRIYRDTRFSPDKTPYKTYLGILFWEGGSKKTECSGYYVQLEPPKFMLSVGIYIFTKAQLKVYRDALVQPESGARFRAALDSVTAIAGCTLGGGHYKQVPRGYDASHINAAYLRYNGLYTVNETAIPAEFYQGALIDYCFEHFRAMSPLHDWLVNTVHRA